MTEATHEMALRTEADVRLRAGLGPTAQTAARWYCVSREGLATLCKDEADAHETTGQCDKSWAAGSPHRAVRLVDAPRWVPVDERMPATGRTVLACYKNQLGNWRRIRAQWVAAKTVEASHESDIGEYDEAGDCFYDPEGWYERIDNWPEYTACTVDEGQITHWMPLPDPPTPPALGPNVEVEAPDTAPRR